MKWTAGVMMGVLIAGSGLIWNLHQAQSQAQSIPMPSSPAPSPAPSPQTSPISPVSRPTLAPASTKFPLRRLSSFPSGMGLDTQLLADRPALLRSIDRSLGYLNTEAAARAYQRYPVAGVTRQRTIRSLRRFRSLLQSAKTPEAFQTQIRAEFDLYESIGKDGLGTVGFTGYYEAVYGASRKPTAEYRYPLYRRPPSFSNWTKPHPTRAQLEGRDGLSASQGKLKGTELVWMRDRLEAFLVQVQGSARLSLTDGSTMTIGFDGNTDYPYVGIGRELVKDGKFAIESLTLPRILQYFQENPADLDEYLPRNQRFVFFRNTQGAMAMGSIGVPVTPRRSIATDKKLMPPGALALLETELPNQSLQPEQTTRFVLDQDTGGAIIGPGRVDIFMGTGDRAKAEAGLVRSEGKLYYLFLK